LYATTTEYFVLVLSLLYKYGGEFFIEQIFLKKILLKFQSSQTVSEHLGFTPDILSAFN